VLLKEEYELVKQKDEFSQQLNRMYPTMTGTAATTSPKSSSHNANKTKLNQNHQTNTSTTASQHSDSGTIRSKMGKRNSLQITKEVMANLIHEYTSVKEKYRALILNQKIWIQRYDSIKNIFIDLRPLDITEKNGKFLKKFFSLQELLDDISNHLQKNFLYEANPIRSRRATRSSSILSKDPQQLLLDSENSSVVTGSLVSRAGTGSLASEVLLDIQALISSDPDLSEALKLIKGKESSLLTALQETQTKTAADQKLQSMEQTNEENGNVIENENQDVNKGDDEEDTTMTKDEDKDQNMVAWVLLKVFLAFFFLFYCFFLTNSILFFSLSIDCKSMDASGRSGQRYFPRSL
jgi:hypothetical protein